MLAGLIKASTILAPLTKGTTNKDIFPALKTYITDPEKFWDSLNNGTSYMCAGRKCFNNKVDVGNLALHHKYMTANAKFDCSNTLFKDLKPSQKRVIASTLKTKDEPYTIVSIRGMGADIIKML